MVMVTAERLLGKIPHVSTSTLSLSELSGESTEHVFKTFLSINELRKVNKPVLSCDCSKSRPPIYANKRMPMEYYRILVNRFNF